MSNFARMVRGRIRTPSRAPSLAGQAFILQVLLTLVLVSLAVAALVLEARSNATGEARQRSLAVARTFAEGPGVARAMAGDHPTALLQPRAEEVRRRTGVDSVVVFDRRGMRLTHPETALIGKRIVGPASVVRDELAGKTVARTFRASQGPSVISAVPITTADGALAGGVSVGVRIDSVNAEVHRQLPLLLGAGGGALALATAGTALTSRRLRRQTHGLGPAEMTRMYAHHDAVLHSVREGVLIMDADGRLLLVNDEARRLLQLTPDSDGSHATALGLEPRLTRLLAAGQPVTDEVHAAGNRLLAVNIRPTDRAGGPAGSVATLRDTTELRALSGRAEAASERLRLLYDAGVRIGSTLELTGTAEELVGVGVPRFADIATVELLEPVLRGEEPAVPHGVLHRTAVGGVPPEHPLFRSGERAVPPPSSPQREALESGQAVLRADLSDAAEWPAGYEAEARRLRDQGIHSLLAVPLQFRGVPLGVATFCRTRPRAPFDDEDLVIAGELAARTAVCVDNARRYTREHTMVTTLQRNLLPGALPDQDAVDVASHYLPARAGVGGDWFDVLPLPGARVALVVGDVAGQGLHAAATMGRLRTAVQNFSALDLPPDEVLALLDELVARLDLERETDSDSARITGATCLYAIYDPVSGRCSVARAGHPGPVVACPDGTVHTPEVPASPPLGLGREPFEAADLPVPEGTRLVLYTNGLVAGHDRDHDTGLDLLRRTLAAAPDRGPADTCQELFATVLPARPSDDAALLVARTRRLAPENVAQWEVPADPAAVAPLRAACAQRIRDWGLDDAAFAAELVISELVTNALRYGAPPVRIRLLRGRSLICEVSDGSSTSPHLRRADLTDEGGRGLFLVSQLARRWGTRYTAHGKVIWAEQPLPGPPG
ncbi:SpoIIE family protein phosphatase [Streptomyces sp. Rer75]|uniref:SpoIIE family protein phosphatase n=1 Tax=Streptomyces sp. Rer75 TaxID=2750011 RepID=UPI0015CFCB92|nr:SpoIIE family protein phosphatase [Streptomyces sp. Rer75]QLH25829.1 SpoIIE family protein phosphatase [Streptomyces sp. Rer75]